MDINLVLLKKNQSSKVFPLSSPVTVIGRRSSCDLRIPLMSVSKKHCTLTYENGKVKILDLGSKNGTHLNGKPVTEDVLKPGDHIGIGPLSFLCQIDGQPANLEDTADIEPEQPTNLEDTAGIEPEQPAIDFEELTETAEEAIDEDALLADFDGLADDSELLETDE